MKSQFLFMILLLGAGLAARAQESDAIPGPIPASEAAEALVSASTSDSQAAPPSADAAIPAPTPIGQPVEDTNAPKKHEPAAPAVPAIGAQKQPIGTLPPAQPVPTPAAAEASPAKSLSLESAISTALHESTPVLKAQRDSEFGGTQVLQSYLQFLPNLGVQGGWNATNGRTFLSTAVPTLVDGKSHGEFYTVSTTLNLFNGFADIASWRAAHDRRDASDKSVTRAKQAISLDVSQSFLQVVLDQKLIAIAEKNLKASQDRETLLDEQTKVGLRKKSDLFRQQAQTSADESYLISVQNKAQDDLVLLLRKLRFDPRENILVTEPPLETEAAPEHLVAPMKEDTAVEEALTHRSDYEIAKLNADASHSDVTTNRSSYWPKLDLFASYTSSGRMFDSQTVNGNDALGAYPFNPLPSMDDQLAHQGQSLYGLVLTWTIFDRWTTSLNVERSKAVAYKADLDSEDYRRQVIGEVRQALSDLKAASKQLETSRRGLVAAQKAFEVSEGRYEVGSISYVDLATAQTALVQAEANRAQALISYELQKRALEYALGTTPIEVSANP